MLRSGELNTVGMVNTFNRDLLFRGNLVTEFVLIHRLSARYVLSSDFVRFTVDLETSGAHATIN